MRPNGRASGYRRIRVEVESTRCELVVEGVGGWRIPVGIIMGYCIEMGNVY